MRGSGQVNLCQHARAIRDALGVRAVWWGLLGSLVLALSSYDVRRLPGGQPVRFFGLHVFGIEAPRWLMGGLTVIGAIGLLVGWLALRPQPMRVRPWAVLALWSFPLLFAAPLFSNDAYSYAAQGRQVMQGVNPYYRGPVVGDPDFTAQVDTFWQMTVAPYGPLSLQMNRGVVELMRADPWSSALGMRLISLLSVVVIVAALYRLIPLTPGGPGAWERMPGVPRATAADHAVWLGALNPMSIIHFVGGAHNDAAMIAFIAVGLAAAVRARQAGQEVRREGWLMLATICIALGAMIKQPAVLVLPAVAVLAQRSRRDYRPHPTWLVQDLVLVVATFLATFVAGSLATGLGFGWVRALKVPGLVASMAPSFNLTKVGQLIARVSGHPELQGAVASGVKLAFVGVAGIVGLWLLVRMALSARKAGQYVVGVLLLLALIMPALQAWYFLWGGALLGMVTLSRRHLDWWCWGMTWLTLASALDTAIARIVPAMGLALVVTLVLSGTPAFREALAGGIPNGIRTRDPDAISARD